MYNTLTLNVSELYEAIQGETSLSGLPTTIVRLTGCNLTCHWCDTRCIIDNKTPLSLKEVIRQIKSYQHRNVCITGGEPLLQKNALPLIKYLCDEDYKVSIETNGSQDLSLLDRRAIVILDIKCPSSGEVSANNFSNLAIISDHDEIKFVIADKTDYQYACSICEQYNLYQHKDRILFSPVHATLDPRELIGWILKDRLPIRLNIQAHKYIWGAQEQGV
ncbi:MAG: radical SAM protein [Chlamydiota bacterium]